MTTQTINHYILTPYRLDEYSPDLEKLAGAGWTVINSPDVEPAQGEATAAQRQERMSRFYPRLAAAVAEAAATGKRPVSVAGDCCATIAVIAGLQRAGINPTLIWLDAHGDFNDWTTTPSGFLGGMPLAMMVGRGDQTLPESVGLRPFPEAQVILADARDLDPGEREAVAGSAVRHLSSVEALLEATLPPGPLYVHFDCDVLNTAEVPAVGYPAPGGPSAATLRRVFRHLADTGQIAAISLTTWDFSMDGDGRSRAIVLGLLDELL
jgi:arginase